jgi:hypothetical protein
MLFPQPMSMRERADEARCPLTGNWPTLYLVTLLPLPLCTAAPCWIDRRAARSLRTKTGEGDGAPARDNPCQALVKEQGRRLQGGLEARRGPLGHRGRGRAA